MTGVSTSTDNGVGNAMRLRQTDIPHGTHCDCVLLAKALGMAPGSIPYHYCSRMLQRRWFMTCKHGERIIEPEAPSAADRWKAHGGAMSSVLAILVSNG